MPLPNLGTTDVQQRRPPVSVRPSSVESDVQVTQHIVCLVTSFCPKVTSSLHCSAVLSLAAAFTVFDVPSAVRAALQLRNLPLLILRLVEKRLYSGFHLTELILQCRRCSLSFRQFLEGLPSISFHAALRKVASVAVPLRDLPVRLSEPPFFLMPY